MSTQIATLVRERRLSRKFVRAVLAAPDRMKKTAGELARELVRAKPKTMTLTVGTDIVLALWREYEAANKTRRHYAKAGRRPSLATRLQADLERKARRLQHCYRSYARQSPPHLNRTPAFAETTIQCRTIEGWVEYSKRFGNRYGITDAWYEFTLQRGFSLWPDWLIECDGIVTVGALRCPDDEEPGEEIYRARWGVQERSGVGMRTGFIIRQTIGEYPNERTFTAHGKTIGAARGVITSRLPASIAARTEAGRQRAERIERITAAIHDRLKHGHMNGYGDVAVTLADSKRAGNCPDGTEHWVEKHFPGRESALVTEVLCVADQRERVLLACLAAIRRQRPAEFATPPISIGVDGLAVNRKMATIERKRC